MKNDDLEYQIYYGIYNLKKAVKLNNDRKQCFSQIECVPQNKRDQMIELCEHFEQIANRQYEADYNVDPEDFICRRRVLISINGEIELLLIQESRINEIYRKFLSKNKEISNTLNKFYIINGYLDNENYVELKLQNHISSFLYGLILLSLILILFVLFYLMCQIIVIRSLYFPSVLLCTIAIIIFIFVYLIKLVSITKEERANRCINDNHFFTYQTQKKYDGKIWDICMNALSKLFQ